MLLALFIAVGTEFEIFGPFILTIFTRFTCATLLTLYAFFTMKIYFSNESQLFLGPIRVQLLLYS
jgi:hypothetical protein